MQQTRPIVASNGALSLAAWGDTRRGTTDVFATRIDAAGAILDLAGIRLPELSTLQLMVWTGAVAIDQKGRRRLVTSRDRDRPFA